MKHIIKQSIIGAIYMFAITSFAAVVIIALYNMVGRQVGGRGVVLTGYLCTRDVGGAIYIPHNIVLQAHARRYPSGVIYVGKRIRYKANYSITYTPRQVYTNILHIDEYIRIYYLTYYAPTMDLKSTMGNFFKKSEGPKKKRKKRNLATARDICIFPY